MRGLSDVLAELFHRAPPSSQPPKRCSKKVDEAADHLSREYQILHNITEAMRGEQEHADN